MVSPIALETANKIEPIKEDFVQGIQENDIQNDKNPIEIINPDFIESSKFDEIGGIDIARNSVLSITGSYAAYRVILETREDPFVGSTYSRKYLIQSGSTYIVGSTPYWESEAIVPFITASRVSEFLKINYSSYFFVKGLSNLSILLCNTLFEVAKIFPPSSAGSFLQLVMIAPEFLIIGIKGSIS